MFAELDNLWMEFWVVPVCLENSAFGVIKDDCFRNATNRQNAFSNVRIKLSVVKR